jgi:hypothetical protein
MANTLKDFRPTFLGDLTRLGASFDGGYVINERAIRSSQYLLSFGIYDDWSFESDFLSRQPNLKVLCFDYSISKAVFRENALDALNEIVSLRFLSLILRLKVQRARQRLAALKWWTKKYFHFSRFCNREDVQFFSKGISSEKNTDFVTLEDVFRMISSEELPENSTFIKMDIEQSEFRVLPDILRFAKCISGMAVEFHDLDILWPNFVELVSRLETKFEITHVHGNNYGGLIPGSKTPKVLEITFLNKTLIREDRGSGEHISYPIPGLDRPNNRLAPDLVLAF